MGKARDEAGNIWETDAQGNPVRMLQPAQSNPMNNPFVDPRLQYQVQAAQGQGAAAQYAAPKAQADAAVAQAQVPYAGTVAQAEAAKAQADAAKAQAELQMAQTKAKGKPVDEARSELLRIVRQIDAIAADANDNKGWFETGYLGSVNRERSGTAAFDLQEKLKTIDANSAFSKLAQMRADSPTGGALGNVSERELDLLRSTVANLNPNQSHQEFLKSLKIARDHYAGMLERLGVDQSALRPAAMGITGGNTQDRVDPETSRQIDAMIAAGRSNDDIIGFARKKGFTTQTPSPEALDAARAYLIANPGYKGGFTQAIDRQQVQQNPVTSSLGIDPSSALGAYGVASANALTMGNLDEIAGGNAQQAKDLLRQEHPGASLAGDITGSALGMAGINGGLRFAGGRLAGLATRGGGIGGDMLYGAGFGAGEGNDDRLTGALTGGLAAGAGNLVGRGLVSGAGRAVRGVSSPDVGYLAGRGVRMTPGQILGQGGALGRGTRAVEDALESIPFLGSAIRMRKMEGLKDFNREAFKDALAPIGEQVQGTLGQDAIGEAQDLVSGAYGNALNGVTLRADLPFVQQAGQHIRAGREIPKVGDEFDYTIRKEIAPLFGPGRTLDGPGFQEASQTAQGAASDFAKMGTRTGGAAANQMRGVRSSLLDLAGRQAPDTVPGLLNANAANKNVSILGDAVTGAVNSNVDGGIFTPAQLGRASVNNTKKFGGRRAAARGDVPFAQLQQAGQAVQPNVIPNSGSFDRAFASLALPTALGGSAIGAEQLNAPTPVVAALGGLSLLSTRKGNDLFQALVTSRNPKVRQLGEIILQRARLGGMFGGASALPYSVNP